METTLGLLGLMKESSNFSFLENFKGEGILPYPIWKSMIQTQAWMGQRIVMRLFYQG
jgi:hypothetical protein